MFNMSMKSGQLPTEWKHANVIPVHKSGDRQIANNYRPIYLLSVVSKIMERCVHEHVYSVVKPQIHTLQHGFVPKRSSARQMLKIYNDIGSVLDKGGQIDIVFLDFCKAFDSVSHSLLVHKLQMYGFSGKLLNWIENYLSGRKQRVLVEGKLSEWLPVTSG